MGETDKSKEETLAIILKKLEKNEENLNKRLDSLTLQITNAKRENNEHFASLEKKFIEYEKLMSFLNSQYEGQKKTIDSLTKENTLMKSEMAEMRAGMKDLAKSINTLERENNDLEQYGRRECIEVNGLPEQQNEKPEEIIIKIASEIGVHIKNDDMVACHRIQRRNGDTGLICKFLNRKKSDEMLGNRKKMKGKTVGSLGFHATPAQRNGKIFINESLTTRNKELFRQARVKTNAIKWKYCWTKNGDVFARKDENTLRVKIRGVEDIENKVV